MLQQRLELETEDTAHGLIPFQQLSQFSSTSFQTFTTDGCLQTSVIPWLTAWQLRSDHKCFRKGTHLPALRTYLKEGKLVESIQKDRCQVQPKWLHDPNHDPLSPLSVVSTTKKQNHDTENLLKQQKKWKLLAKAKLARVALLISAALGEMIKHRWCNRIQVKQ